MARRNPGHSTSTNQDQDTGMAPNQSTEQARGQGSQGKDESQWSKRSGERDGAQARRRSRLDPDVSGTPDSGED